jgi:hypothetical protein
MFASRTITEHLLRGAAGIGLFVASAALLPTHPLLALLALPLALLALRGCPMCWTMGLIETIAKRVTGKPTSNACVDGSCARLAKH